MRSSRTWIPFLQVTSKLLLSMANLLDDLEWQPGDRCYAVFSEDSLWYPAIIMKKEMG